MSITSFIAKVCKQTAVYWGSPTDNGFGGYTYADPVEIKCRWEDTVQLIETNNGRQVVTDAEILLTQEVDEGGFLYLGTLADIGVSAPIPEETEGARYIIAKGNVPTFKNTETVHSCWLGKKQKI